MRRVLAWLPVAVLAVGLFWASSQSNLRFEADEFADTAIRKTGHVLVYAIGPRALPTVGASTAIFGLLGALFIFSIRHRHTVAGMALRSVGFWLVLNLFITFTQPGISWQGHIGGLIGGIATFEALSLAGRKDLRDRIELPDGAAVLVIVGALVLLTIWRSFTF